jgi:hypothetical protein
MIIWIMILMTRVIITKIIVRYVGWIPVVLNKLYIQIEIDIDIAALNINKVVVKSVEISFRNIRNV